MYLFVRTRTAHPDRIAPLTTFTWSTTVGSQADIGTADKIAQAMGWGVEIMNHVHAVTGRDGGAVCPLIPTT